MAQHDVRRLAFLLISGLTLALASSLVACGDSSDADPSPAPAAPLVRGAGRVPRAGHVCPGAGFTSSDSDTRCLHPGTTDGTRRSPCAGAIPTT